MLHPSWSKKKMGFTATTYVPTACRYICISVHLAHRPSSRILHKCTGGVKCKKVPTRYIHIVFVTVLRLLHFCHTESLLQNWERIIYGNSLRTNYILFRTQFTKIPGAMNVTFFSSDSVLRSLTPHGRAHERNISWKSGYTCWKRCLGYCGVFTTVRRLSTIQKILPHTVKWNSY